MYATIFAKLRYVLIFAVYTIMQNFVLPPATLQNTDNLRWINIFIEVISACVVFFSISVTLRRKSFTSADWGLQLRSKEWLSIGFIGAAAVYFGVVDNRITFYDVIVGGIIALQFTTYELVFRAATMNLILKDSGRGFRAILLAAFISTIIYGAVLWPLEGFSREIFGVILVLSIVFEYTRLIALFVFLMALYVLPGSSGMWVGVFTILVYLSLSLTMNRVERKVAPGGSQLSSS